MKPRFGSIVFNSRPYAKEHKTAVPKMCVVHKQRTACYHHNGVGYCSACRELAREAAKKDLRH